MGKKKKNEMCEADIEFEIQETEVLLDKLKQMKQQILNKPVTETQFENLPESVEAIAAHIAIRLGSKVLILWEYDDISFHIYDSDVFSLKDYDILFDGEGKHRIHTASPICYFSLNEGEDITIKWFGCVISPNGEEYTIKPLNLNRDGNVVCCF